MRKNLLKLLTISILACLCVTPSMANWQYSGTYVGDGWFRDDGSRFVISARGGASYSRGTVQNDVGALTTAYYYDPATGAVISDLYYYSCATGDCSHYELAGQGELGKLPPNKDYSSFAVAIGASLGFTIPNRPQWRAEVGWDHIAESEYNVSPLFEGDMLLTGGTAGDVMIFAQSGGVQSKISTDIISAMIYYDFFDGLQKPIETTIPYIGFGVGYADVKTTLHMSDLYGDLSSSIELQNYGNPVQYGDVKLLDFYKSEYTNSTIAGIVAAGISYGITETMFLDFGARIAYVPKVKWTLSNNDGTRHRDWFSAKNMIYANVMLGLRFEF